MVSDRSQNRYDAAAARATYRRAGSPAAVSLNRCIRFEIPAFLTAERRHGMLGVLRELEPGPDGPSRLAFGPLRLHVPPVRVVDDEAFVHLRVAFRASWVGHVIVAVLGLAGFIDGTNQRLGLDWTETSDRADLTAFERK